MKKETFTKCPSCGELVPAKSKTCSSCGCKISKPIYKRVWFIALAVIIVLAIIGSLLPDDDTSPDPGESTQVESGQQSEQQSEPVSEPEPDPEPQATLGEQNALDKAYSYLDYAAFSKKGLREQLEFEGFSKAEAKYGVNNCGANWKEQAAKKAQDYLDYSSFSRQGLIDQLLFEGFTQEQAEYGVEAVGY